MTTRDASLLSGTTVLLVEDDSGTRSFASQVLRAMGLTVLEAADGPGGLAAAAIHSGPIALLVADVVMPGFAGDQVGRMLEELRPGLKVLYISGYPESELRPALPEGAVLLPKPFLARELEE